jgi:hypothetical protein
MRLLFIFIIGIVVGFLSQRFAFCLFGSIIEFFSLGSTRRIVGVLAAMIAFSFIHIWGYKSAPEYAGLPYLLGGFIQGIGYVLALGCPLGLLVRTGEGNKFHMVVFIFFIIGIGIYSSVFQGMIHRFLGPFSYGGAITLFDIFR